MFFTGSLLGPVMTWPDELTLTAVGNIRSSSGASGSTGASTRLVKFADTAADGVPAANTVMRPPAATTATEPRSKVRVLRDGGCIACRLRSISIVALLLVCRRSRPRTLQRPFETPPQTQVAIEAYDPVEQRAIAGKTLQVYEIST
jgi:hypothetical protein